jgi:hypothetical protein
VTDTESGERAQGETGGLEDEAVALAGMLIDVPFYLAKYSPQNKPWNRRKRSGQALAREALALDRTVSPWFDVEWYRAANSQHLADEDLELGALNHFLLEGWRLGFNPSPSFDTWDYLDMYSDVDAAGINPLVHFVTSGLKEGRLPKAPEEFDDSRVGAFPNARRSRVLSLLESRWEPTNPIRILPRVEQGPSVFLVTDSFAPTSLFGGVATSLLLASTLAAQLGRPLHLLTRVDDLVNLDAVAKTIQHYGVALPEGLHHQHVPHKSPTVVVSSPEDLFIGTSWWSTAALLNSDIDPKRIIYLLQEDEREFYPSGDERLRAHDVMNNPHIHTVVNTHGLLDYLAKNGLSDMATSAVAFEPAFPPNRDSGRDFDSTKGPSERRKRLFFYARPNNFRSLFYLGVEVLDRVMLEGVLNPGEWDLVFAGKDIPRLEFSVGKRPLIAGAMSHSSYSRFLGTFDLALSLMATPHPSYPPLDFAAAGVPVITNSWNGKKNLSEISPLIHMAEPNVDALTDAIRTALRLDHQSGIIAPLLPPYSNTWEQNLQPPVRTLAERLNAPCS